MFTTKHISFTNIYYVIPPPPSPLLRSTPYLHVYLHTMLSSLLYNFTYTVYIVLLDFCYVLQPVVLFI